MLQIPQSTTRRVMLKLFTSGTTSAATGKTVAITISKAGASFGNPSAGATNASELSNGWYYVDLSTTDTNTLGDLIIRGTATGCDDTERIFGVVKATTGGLTALPDVADYIDTEISAIRAKTDNLPSSPAATGDIPSANTIATALLDLADGVETSITVRKALRGMLSALAAKLSGAATNTVVIRDVNDTVNRITATVDSNGNRSAVTLNL